MSRVQVQDLPNPERFRPAQPTGDTYGGYERPVIDQNWDRLSQALASFSSNISQFARQKQPNANGETVRAEYERDVQLLGADRAYQNYLSGGIQRVQGEAPIRTAISESAGNRAAEAWVQREKQALETGTYPLFNADGTPIPVDATHASRVQSQFAGLPPALQLDPRRPSYEAAGYQRGFSQAAEAVRAAAVAKQTAEIANERNDQINGLITRFLSPVAEAAGRQDVTDDQLRELWTKQKEELRRLTGNVMRYDRMDNRMVGTLRDLAQTNPEAAIRLITLDRGNASDGTRLGPLYGSPGRDDLNDVLRTARAKAATNYDSRMLDTAATQAAAEIRAGRGAGLQGATDVSYTNPFDPNPSTATRRLSAETVRTEAYSRAATAEAATIRQQGSSPEATDEALFQSARRLYIQSNVPNPAWREAINGAVRISADPAALTDPANQARVTQAMRLYERLGREHSGYLRTLGINEDAQLLFERTAILRDKGGVPEDRALREAAASIGAGRNEALDAAARQRLNSTADSLGSSWWGWRSAGTNVLEARRNVLSLAERYMFRSDIKPEDAIKQAAEVLQNRVVNLNGRSLIGDRWVTKESAPYWQGELNRIVQEYGAVANGSGSIRDARQLSVRPINNGGAYEVVDQRGEPVVAPVRDPNNPERFDMRPVVIDPKRVQQFMEQDLAQKKASELAENQRQQTIKQLETQLQMDDNARIGGRSAGQRQRLTPEQRAAVQAQLDDLRGPQGPAQAPQNPDAPQPSPTRSMPFGTQRGIVERQNADEPPERQTPPVQMPQFLRNILSQPSGPRFQR